MAIGIVAVLAIALSCGAIYAEVRLSLTGALTIIRGRIVIKNAWRATNGQFWTLFGTYLLISLVFGVVDLIFTAFLKPQMIAASASFDQQAMNAAVREQVARQGTGLSAVMLVPMAIGALIFVVLGAVALGAVATAALDLGGPLATGDVRDR